MTEVARDRDWLGELGALVAADQLEAFQALAKEALKAAPDLEDKVFAMTAEYAASPKKEKAADFFAGRCYLKMRRRHRYNQSLNRFSDGTYRGWSQSLGST